MAKQRGTFSTDFKAEAANLVISQEYSIGEASRSLGVGESAIRRWVFQLTHERSGITPGPKR